MTQGPLWTLLSPTTPHLSAREEAAIEICVDAQSLPAQFGERLKEFLEKPSAATLATARVAAVSSPLIAQIEPVQRVLLISTMVLGGTLTPAEAAARISTLDWSQIDALPPPERAVAEAAQFVHHDDTEGLMSVDEDDTFLGVVRRLCQTRIA